MDDIEDASEEILFEYISKDRNVIREKIEKLSELDSKFKDIVNKQVIIDKVQLS